jgi:hypothetical protein
MTRPGQAGPFGIAAVCLAALISLAPPAEAAGEPPVLFLAGTVASRDDLAEPVYDVVIALKARLARAGFRVVLTPAERFDAVLVLNYREARGREYRNLEHGTAIDCRLSLHDPASPSAPPLRTYEMRAETSWPAPMGSRYWDAVQHLEENAYYYFLGDLVYGWWTRRAETAEVFARVLAEPPARVTTDGGDDVVTARMAANHAARLHAIDELARLRDPRTLALLWDLVRAATPAERLAAVRAIAAIGTPEALEGLRALVDSEQDVRVREVAVAATGGGPTP